MKRFITILISPFLVTHLFFRFCTSIRLICEEDQRHTAQCRISAFQNPILQFIYFILWLPEYRSVFYMRCGLLGKLICFTPPISTKYIAYQNIT